jgi:hypothetical protein
VLARAAEQDGRLAGPDQIPRVHYSIISGKHKKERQRSVRKLVIIMTGPYTSLHGDHPYY